MTITATATTTPAGETVSGRFAFTLPVTPADLRKPAYAYAGLADLAIEQVKDLPALYVTEVKKVSARLAETPQVVRTLPARVEELRSEVETRVSTAYGKASEQAGDLYAQLAVRGERLVTSIRRQPATEAAVVEGKEAVREAEAAVTAARSSARAGRKAAAGAAKKIG